MKKTTKKVVKVVPKEINDYDYVLAVTKSFKDQLGQILDMINKLSEKMNQHFEKLENRMGNIEFELSGVKDIVIDIQQEKAPRTEVLALAKRITKLEMTNEKNRKILLNKF